LFQLEHERSIGSKQTSKQTSDTAAQLDDNNCQSTRGQLEDDEEQAEG
jgi:hypothetical protein